MMPALPPTPFFFSFRVTTTSLFPGEQDSGRTTISLVQTGGLAHQGGHGTSKALQKIHLPLRYWQHTEQHTPEAADAKLSGIRTSQPTIGRFSSAFDDACEHSSVGSQPQSEILGG